MDSLCYQCRCGECEESWNFRVFDANDITNELWNSNQNLKDHPGNYAKFASPAIAIAMCTWPLL